MESAIKIYDTTIKSPIVIGDSGFSFKWLKHKGFYCLLWYYLYSFTGYYARVNSKAPSEIWSFMELEPDKELLESGYMVVQTGIFFGKPIFRYIKINN